MMVTEKSREVRMRRMAKRQGLALQASGRRDPHALDFGRYLLLDESGAVVAGVVNGRPGFTLDDVERYLTTPRDER